jgi:hypothetical protein
MSLTQIGTAKSVTPRGKNKKNGPFFKDYQRLIKYKPFHCKFPGCDRRFKRLETLTFHQNVHGSKETNERRDELQQGIADKKQHAKVRPFEESVDIFSDAKYGRKSIVFTALKKGHFKTGSKHKKTGTTLLITACEWGQDEIVAQLLIRRADVNLCDNHMNSPLAKAVMYGHIKIVKMLLDAHADPNLQNDCGVTPAMRAAMYGHTEILKLLIDGAGALFRPRDLANRQCLDYAKLYKHEEALQYLKEVHKRPIEGKRL